jgi:hypothetical protein
METKNTTKELIFNDQKREIRIGVSKADEKAKKSTIKRKTKAPLSLEESIYTK